MRAGMAGAAMMALGMLAAPSRSARAQDLLYVFAGGGPMFPAPPLLHPTASPGLDVLVGAVVRRFLAHTGLRVAASYDEVPAARPLEGFLSFASGTVNVARAFWADYTVVPYAFVGGGYYSYNSSIRVRLPPPGTPPPPLPQRGHQDAFGLDGGAGVRVPFGRFFAFLEARENLMFLGPHTRSYVPVTLGVAYVYSPGVSGSPL
jgi:hypothetical protein